jgi:hypothetical protein|tara:strand:- start:124 stop:291 length:168 start_codon:yes stop_codon:yes gene_type:complete
MEKKFSIDEILTAVYDLQNKKKQKIIEVEEVKTVKKEKSDIPVNTLRLIIEAENL